MKGKLSDEQMMSLLETAERKASDEKKPQMLKDVRDKLAELYIKGGRFEQAAKCLGCCGKPLRIRQKDRRYWADCWTYI